MWNFRCRLPSKWFAEPMVIFAFYSMDLILLSLDKTSMQNYFFHFLLLVSKLQEISSLFLPQMVCQYFLKIIKF